MALSGGLQGTEVKPALPKTTRSRAQDWKQDEQWNSKRRGKSIQARHTS